ncbi:MAG: molybdopterin-dependent oxidoreductase, partial [Gemmatimonadota bacterium]
PGHPLAVGAWRAPSANTNYFAVETHIDPMAAAAGIDPVSYRLEHLADERARRVLQTAADRFGGDFVAAPSGRGHGVAVALEVGTWVAAIAEVDVDEERGTVRVARIVCAQDMGEVINPRGAVLQSEGALTMGLGYALGEEIRFEGGAVLDENFGSYQIPRFSWVPEIEVVLVDNPDLSPQGGGEPAITVMGAVLANAVHDACGARVYDLPMTPTRVKNALAAGPVPGA